MLIVEEKAADLADWPDPKFAPAPCVRAKCTRGWGMLVADLRET
eukprot:SAG11_NODE_305_length_10996_cov_4.698082_9_plen_44_part_00